MFSKRFHRKADVCENRSSELQLNQKETTKQVFSSGICECFKKTLFHRTSPVVASDILRFPACNFMKKWCFWQMFFCEFCKSFKSVFLQNISGWLLFVFICEFWKVFQNSSFIEHLLETAYFMYMLQNVNHQIQKKTIWLMLFKHHILEREVAIWRHLFTSNHWKLSVKKLICNEVGRYLPASLWKKPFHISSFMYLSLICSEYIMITSSISSDFLMNKIWLLTTTAVIIIKSIHKIRRQRRIFVSEAH